MVLKNAKGFTLIELLVVVAIIGILAAIAIPQFAAYRESAFCGRVESDVRNAMTSEEAYYVENESYVSGQLDDTTLPGFATSPDVTVTATNVDPLTITGVHDSCTRGTFTLTAGGNGQWG